MLTPFGEFVAVPPGDFLMGNDHPFLAYGGTPREEHVQTRHIHRVRITRKLGFLSTLLTCEAVASFIVSEEERFRGVILPWKQYADPDGVYATSDSIFHPPGEAHLDVGLADYLTNPANGKQPAVGLSHDEALAFCEFASSVVGARVRLPTEAEWEYACKAGTTSLYYFGDNTKDVPSHAWCCVNSGLNAHPVGAYPPNPWGLYDMIGNAWEWCADRYAKEYYQVSPVDDPHCTDESKGEFVVRGSGSLNKAETCRSAHRFGLKPGTRSRFLGLRPVVEMT
jgi:formylglycine-generating enzyme required for sulfatase activity